MQNAQSSDPIPQLTLSVVLFHSPLEQLRALVESVITSLRAAHLSGVKMVCWDNSCDAAYSAQCQQLLADFASQDVLVMNYVIADHNGGYGAGHNPRDVVLRGAIPSDLESRCAAFRRGDPPRDGGTDVGALHCWRPRGDDSGEPEYLAKAYPSVWVLGLRAFGPAWLKRLSGRALARYEMRDQPNHGEVRPITLASGCCMWVRREIFDAVGGFDERFFLYFEDYDLSLKMAQRGQVLEHSQIRIVHHGGDAARKGARHIRWFISGAIRFFNRWGWKWFGLIAAAAPRGREIMPS